MIALTPQGQVISQLELYAVDVQTLHDERTTIAERLVRAHRDIARVLHQRDTLRKRLENEFQRAEILRTERDALVLAGSEARAREKQRDARGRLRCVVVASVAMTVGLAVGAVPLL
jgi:hypothetical protein